MPKLFLAVFVSLITICNIAAGKVFHQKLNYRIIVQEKPTKVQKFAAAELKKFLDLTYSSPIIMNGTIRPMLFLVGFPSEAIFAGFTKLPNMKSRFGVFQSGNAILLYGSDAPGVDPTKTSLYETGTLSAVYYFLTKYAGTGFYFPGEKGFAVTPNKPILFMSRQDIPKPTFEVRGIRSNKNKEFSSRELNIFSRRMLCNRPFWSRYDYYYIFMKNWKKRFWKTNPDYFMMRNGKRISARYPWHTPCLSNPNTVKQTATDIIAKININPQVKVIRLFCDAPVELCQCAKCNKSDARKRHNELTGVSEELYGFQKKVMNLVHETHPDIYFISQTKGRSYGQPPVKVKMGPKFVIEILTRRPNPTADYTASIKQAQAWEKAGVKTILKSYPRYPDFKNYPIISPAFTQSYLKQFVGVARGAYLTETQKKSYSLSALNLFIQAKVLFNIKANNKRLVAEFCNFAYPKAEKEMIAFYREMERLFMKTRDVYGNHLATIYYVDNLAIAKSLLDTAAKKIKKDAYWFNKLNADFNAFYKKSLAARPQADIIRKASAPPVPFTIPKLSQSIKLDASTGPAKWSEAIKHKLMPLFKYKDFQQSNVYLACDNKNLYIGLVAKESNLKKMRQKCRTNHQGPIWGDDCFEIMLVPDNTGQTYYQIGVNSLGVYRVLYHEKGKPNRTLKDFAIQTAAAVNKENWTVEMKVPLSQFDSADFSKTWKFNTFRTRVLDGDKTSRQSSGIRLFYSGSYHKVKHYHLLNWPKLEKSFWQYLKFW
jgi:uncharacterized protein DUF4838/cellulose/xylan binding protein with CBM9 domain